MLLDAEVRELRLGMIFAREKLPANVPVQRPSVCKVKKSVFVCLCFTKTSCLLATVRVLGDSVPFKVAQIIVSNNYWNDSTGFGEKSYIGCLTPGRSAIFSIVIRTADKKLSI